MDVEIKSLDHLDDRDEFEAVIREYLADVLAELNARIEAPVSLDPLVRATLDNIGAYLPPNGALWQARSPDGTLVATICLKMIRPDAAEIKRLYIRPAARRLKLGRRLTLMAMDKAAELGAKRILIDTGRWMTPAIQLYSGLGFTEIPRYPESENDPALGANLIYMEKVF